jgi:hypothetical protein
MVCHYGQMQSNPQRLANGIVRVSVAKMWLYHFIISYVSFCTLFYLVILVEYNNYGIFYYIVVEFST